MSTLNWIGKEAVVEPRRAVSFRLLESVLELSCGPADAGSPIVAIPQPGNGKSR